MMLVMICSRRELLAGLGTAALGPCLPAVTQDKPMRGVFIIMATPYTESDAVDYEDLAREVDFLDRCGVQGMVWPQLASEYSKLTREERLRGMEAIGKAAKGRKPALVLGVQGPNKAAALAYLEKAESVAPDALIAIPPTEAKSLDDFREYYRALARATRRPLFIQTTGGAKGIVPATELLVELANEFPHCGYVKEEQAPVIERMRALGRHRPAIRSIFSGAAGKGMLYEMRMGFDGTMPGAGSVRRLLVLINMETQAAGMRPYLFEGVVTANI